MNSFEKRLIFFEKPPKKSNFPKLGEKPMQNTEAIEPPTGAEKVRTLYLTGEKDKSRLADELFKELEKDDREKILENLKIAAAKNSSDPEILALLEEEKNPEISLLIAANQNTPYELLEKMAKDYPEDKIRNLIAKHPNTKEETLLWMIEKDHNEENGTISALSNKNISYPVLTKFANECENAIKADYISENPNCDEEIMAILAEKKDPDIRQLVAKNAKTGQKTLERLSNDSNKNVRWEAIKRIENPDFLENIAKRQPEMAVALILNPNLPENTLEELLDAHRNSSPEDIEVKSAIAKRPNNPSYIVKKITDNGFSESEGKVEEALLENIFTPPETLIAYASDKRKTSQIAKNTLRRIDSQENEKLFENLYEEVLNNTDLIFLIAENNISLPNLMSRLPSSLLKSFTNAKKFDGLLSSSEFLKLQAYLAGNIASPEVLEILSKSEDPVVLGNIARNRQTPPAILKKLARNKDQGIAEDAKWNLLER